jgi:uncharacterized protein (TIGR00251 family)
MNITQLPVKVVPGSSRNCIAGWLGEALRVRVMAPPERGKANTAVEKIIADALGIPNDAVNIVRGSTSPRKIVEIAGLAEPEIRSRLERQDQ